jgi:uncharacterized protein (TIGR03435 family)
MVLEIAKDEKGGLSAKLYSIDQNGPPITADAVNFDRGTLRYANNFLGLTYEGKMSADGNSITGTLTQNGSVPLLLVRTKPETAWSIPASPQIPAMASNAKPGVEVATIKPSSPDAPRSGLRLRGGEIVIERMSLNDLIEYSWGVHEKQVVGGPRWMETGKWDIEAKPDTPGMPSSSQLRELVQKLVADRFALKFHEEKREMSAYVLSVDKDGPKMKQSMDSSLRAGYSVGPGGLIRMRDATMEDFAALLQRTTLDRPVLDRTGLEHRWDFVLKWLPDETQFSGQLKPPPPDDPAAGLPPLFTAIQEQLGLKLVSQEVDVPVMVIEHVDHPTPN